MQAGPCMGWQGLGQPQCRQSSSTGLAGGFEFQRSLLYEQYYLVEKATITAELLSCRLGRALVVNSSCIVGTCAGRWVASWPHALSSLSLFWCFRGASCVSAGLGDCSPGATTTRDIPIDGIFDAGIGLCLGAVESQLAMSLICIFLGPQIEHSMHLPSLIGGR